MAAGFRSVAVKGAEMLDSLRLRESPMSACFRAPQSLAPSPIIPTTKRQIGGYLVGFVAFWILVVVFKEGSCERTRKFGLGI
jgi:hypothetical protein